MGKDRKASERKDKKRKKIDRTKPKKVKYYYRITPGGRLIPEDKVYCHKCRRFHFKKSGIGQEHKDWWVS